MQKRTVTWAEMFDRLSDIDQPGVTIYGVPKGGMIAAGFVCKAEVTHRINMADIILDDILQSGRTRESYRQKHPNTPFRVLFDKRQECTGEWLEMPWEVDHPNGQDNVQDNITRILQYLGEDTTRVGLVDTPNRVVRSWDELFAGYNQEVEPLLTSFDEPYSGTVLARNVEFHSTCEHHFLPFSGLAHIAYIPGALTETEELTWDDRFSTNIVKSTGIKVVGASKLCRLLQVYTRRLQIQERIAEKTVEAIMTYIKPTPKGAACILEARHMCMVCRGVQQSRQDYVTPVYRGVFLDDEKTRAEFLALIAMGRHAY